MVTAGGITPSVESSGALLELFVVCSSGGCWCECCVEAGSVLEVAKVALSLLSIVFPTPGARLLVVDVDTRNVEDIACYLSIVESSLIPTTNIAVPVKVNETRLSFGQHGGGDILQYRMTGACGRSYRRKIQQHKTPMKVR